MIHPVTKGFYLLLVIGVFSGISCERARSLVSDFRKKTHSPSSSIIAGPLITELSAGEIDGFMHKKDRLVLVYYHALWSGPCRLLDSYLQKVTAEHAGVVVVGKIDIDQFPVLSNEKSVKDVPDLRLFRDGRMVDRAVGYANDEIIHALIAKHAAGLKLPTGQGKEETHPKPLTAPMPKEWLPPGVKRR